MVNPQRVFALKPGKIIPKGPVIYWMSRDQRASDNWALTYTIEQANTYSVPVCVVFTLSKSFLGANLRHYTFMIDGLKEVEEQLSQKGIQFKVLMGEPTQMLPQLISDIDATLLVSDFDPLRVKQLWKQEVNSKIIIPHFEVDAHNIVPCRVASPKLEYGAYTIRPKISKLLAHFLTDFPTELAPKKLANGEAINWEKVMAWLNPDESVKPISWLLPGYKFGMRNLDSFAANGLVGYSEKRNNPLAKGQSNLSPYIHYGQISAQRIAIEVSKAVAPQHDKSAFLEELIIRRELSDNFCFYNPNYDSTTGFHTWAIETHRIHAKDERAFLYSKDQLEQAKTHDPLWNAAQNEMVNTGKMHGYMRMYWAKKILEWTKTPEQAMEIAVFLNDKYSLDGRDPNGYAGIAWSIGGTHDRAWVERPIFGKIRYMNYNGCKRKFDVNGYIERFSKST